jgi:hypothetical protein
VSLVPTRHGWDARRRAEHLGSRRDQLVRRLPARIRVARKLTPDVRELVVDDAIEFTALHHETPVPSAQDLERVFWDAALKRAQQAADGRHNTVRAGFTRADPDALAELADPRASDPARAVEARVELAWARELAAELDEPEQLVLKAKYQADGPDGAGYKVIARTLGWTVGEVRKVEARIKYKRDRFAAITAAGRLCAWRGPAIAALAAGDASERQAAVAHAHLNECPTCTVDYIRQLRYLRSARFEHKVAQLLPPVTAASERRTGVRDLVADWVARVLGHDAPNTALQLTAGGAGRGIGTAAALKLAALCTGGTIGACVATGVIALPAHVDPPPAHPVATRTPTANTRPAKREPQLPHGTVRATPTPTATARPARRKRTTTAKRASSTQGATGPRSHEQAPASPAPSNAAAGGASEFDPTYQPNAAPAPAPVPAGPGASEFG